MEQQMPAQLFFRVEAVYDIVGDIIILREQVHEHCIKKLSGHDQVEHPVLAGHHPGGVAHIFVHDAQVALPHLHLLSLNDHSHMSLGNIGDLDIFMAVGGDVDGIFCRTANLLAKRSALAKEV